MSIPISVSPLVGSIHRLNFISTDLLVSMDLTHTGDENVVIYTYMPTTRLSITLSRHHGTLVSQYAAFHTFCMSLCRYTCMGRWYTAV